MKQPNGSGLSGTIMNGDVLRELFPGLNAWKILGRFYKKIIGNIIALEF